MSKLWRWFRWHVWVDPVEMPPGYEPPPLRDRFKVFIGIRGRF